MPRAFISHSSKQKTFINQLESDLKSLCCIDSKSFEIGMLMSEEIYTLIGKCDLFVICLSDEALNSDWVNNELLLAYEKLSAGEIERIYPIIIDNKINYNDCRIPEWLKNNYNIKSVIRTGKAYRLIKARLREISWKKHEKIKDKELLFVGRNDELNKIEERLDDIDTPSPRVLVASGVPKVGRNKLLKKALFKSNIVFRESIEFPVISLTARESIEDFILKIYDLGLSEERIFPNFITTSNEDKIEILSSLVLDIIKSKEIVFIDDSGSIILHDGNIVEWFWNLLADLQMKENRSELLFCIASNFRPKNSLIFNYNDIFHISLTVLKPKERIGLLKRLAILHDISLEKNDYDQINKLLIGFPEQIFFVINYIETDSVFGLLKNQDIITNYNKKIFDGIVKDFEGDDEICKSILFILVEFDFISYELLFELLSDNGESVQDVINKLNYHCIIDFLGSNKEYIRLNDGIKNYLLRLGYHFPASKRSILQDHINKFLTRSDIINGDISDYFYSLKGALLSDNNLKNEHLLPSHYLKTMVHLYEIDRKYKDVVILADKLMENKDKLDPHFKREVQYWLCLSLARLTNDRFKTEVQFFKRDADYFFLFGFYYRLKGWYENALESFMSALKIKPDMSKAKRELVQVLNLLEYYPDAVEYAKSNYEKEPSNPFHIQAYYDCLIRNHNLRKSVDIIDKLLVELSSINSEKAREMLFIAKIDYEFYVNNNPEKALQLIDQSSAQYKRSQFVINKKFLIAEKSADINKMESAINTYLTIKDKENMNINDKNNYVIMTSKLLAHKGETIRAIDCINNDLPHYPKKAKSKIIDYIKSISI